MTEALSAFAEDFTRRLDAMLNLPEAPQVLADAIRYAVLAPGKRVRPYLVVECCRVSKGDVGQAYPAAAAVECVHAFSLVHDDLPAMDDDDLRRGRPTVHRQFGEAIAILAGDALLAVAFELLGRNLKAHPRFSEMVTELAVATGCSGMIGGQAEDVLHESAACSLEKTKNIHCRKTARLMEACGRLGALAADAAVETSGALAVFGRHLGLAFQISDDLLDLTSVAAVVGKAVRKDAASGKQTYPGCVGVEGSQRALEAERDRAFGALHGFGSEADGLRDLVNYVVRRTF